MPVELAFYGGVNGTIGGNAIVVKTVFDGKVRQYLFDFGIPPREYGLALSLGLDQNCSLDDLIQMKLVTRFEDFNFRACFITHAHKDHYLALPALFNSKSRPLTIWASKTTSRIIKQYFNKIEFTESILHSDPIAAGQYYQDLHSELPGGFSVVPYPVDHDVPGACCYSVLTDKSMITYTGDFRDHGPLSKLMSRQFWVYLNDIAKSRNRILITEGTNYGLPYSHWSDEHFQDRIRDILEVYSDELIVFTLDRDGVWDLLTCVKAILFSQPITKRKIIVSQEIITFLSKVEQSFVDDYAHVIDGMEANCTMYLRRDKFIVVNLNSEDRAQGLLREIAKSPSDFIIIATKKDSMRIMRGVSMFQTRPGGCCVMSFSSGDEDPEENFAHQFAKSAADLGYSVERTNAPVRGHISPHKLLDVIQNLRPNKIFIVHTLSPLGLQDFILRHTNAEVIVPSLNTPMQIE